MSHLTPKQQKFFKEYLVDMNGTQAAIRAGYSKKTAKSIASALLKRSEVQEAISARRKEMEAETGITAERVLQGYARIAFFDVRKLVDDRGRMLPLHRLDADAAMVLAGFDQKAKTVRLVDRKGALDGLARHLGLFNDKIEHTGKDGAPLLPEMSMAEVARRMLFILKAGVAEVEAKTNTHRGEKHGIG